MSDDYEAVRDQIAPGDTGGSERHLKTILVTGSSGLIGRRITRLLEDRGFRVERYDSRDAVARDTRDRAALADALSRASGIVHLAAVSRVVWAERDPALTQAVNVVPLEQIAAHARASAIRPWVIFASSREVYGESAVLPVAEHAPLVPLNTYARSKVAGERIVAGLAADGFVANICRFSNVYGSTDDHVDRVVPAFARAVACGGTIRIDGAANVFDFTHVEDVAQGLLLAVLAAHARTALPPIHFVTGQGHTLGELAEIARRHALKPIEIVHAPPRDFDVARFYGSPALAKDLLGWQASTNVATGVAQLIADMRADATARLVVDPVAPVVTLGRT